MAITEQDRIAYPDGIPMSIAIGRRMDHIAHQTLREGKESTWKLATTGFGKGVLAMAILIVGGAALATGIGGAAGMIAGKGAIEGLALGLNFGLTGLFSAAGGLAAVAGGVIGAAATVQEERAEERQIRERAQARMAKKKGDNGPQGPAQAMAQADPEPEPDMDRTSAHSFAEAEMMHREQMRGQALG